MRQFKPLTAKQVDELANAIFVRYNFEGEFTILQDLDGNTFTDISDAQDFLRKHVTGVYWEISTLDEAVRGSGMRDNI